jgi:alkyl hydroperoxide reductase subunit F
MLYDVAIIGGGPAGVAAGVYAARKKLRTVFITKDFGGQSVVSTGIQNWIGTVEISGVDLAENLKKHLLAYAGDTVDVKEGLWVKEVSKKEGAFRIDTDQGAFEAKTILITTGSTRRKLPALNADRLEHKGLTYCASCDGPLFAGKEVVVVGGGNAAFETAAQLLAYCPKVTIIHRGGEFRADPVTVEKVLAHPNIVVIKYSDITEVHGEKMVEKVVYHEKGKGEKEMTVGGVFVEIGSMPATEFAKNIVELTPYKQIKVDPHTQRTSQQGIWAAGDCTDGLYHQNNIAAGDAVKALEDMYLYLRAK